MNLKNKLLSVNLIIYIDNTTFKMVKATCIGVGTLIPKENQKLIIKRGTLKKENGDYHTLFPSGPIVASAVENQTNLYFSQTSVRKIDGRPIEKYLGINLKGWTFEELYMRFYMELAIANRLYKNKFGMSKLNKAPTNPAEFIERLKFIRNIPKIKTKEEMGKEMLLDLYDLM